MNEKQFIQLPTSNGVELIFPGDIISVCSEDKTICVNLEAEERRMVNMPIGKAEKVLSQSFFARCHQRHIVNPHCSFFC